MQGSRFDSFRRLILLLVGVGLSGLPVLAQGTEGREIYQGSHADLTQCIAGDVPGTSADKTLTVDVTRLVCASEIAYSQCRPTILKAELVGPEGSGIKERWHVQSCRGEFRYDVTLTPDPAGGTGILLHRLDHSEQGQGSP